MKADRRCSGLAGSSPLVRPSLGILLLLCSISLAPAATRTWVDTGGGLWNDSANWSGGVIPDSTDDVFISANGTYTVTVEQTAQFASLTLGGGTGTQTLRWTGGSLPGNITVQSGAVLRFGITGFNSLFGDGVMNNHGTIIWESTATQPWSMHSASIVNHIGALIDLQADSTFSLFSGSPYIQNNGTIRKSGGTAFSTFNAGVAFTNRGSIQIQTGTMHFTGGFTSSSGFDVSAGARLDLHDGTFNLEPGHSVTGVGSYGVFNSGSPVINGPIIHNNFLLDSGALYMTNELRGTLQWRGGSLSTDIIITPTGVLNYEITGFNSLHSGVITNQGLIRWTTNATQPWSMHEGDILNAGGGLIDLQRDSTFSRFSGTAFIQNDGTIRKSGGTAFSTFNAGIDITNRGTVQIQTGTMHFTGGFTSSSGFDVSGGASLDLHNGTFNLEPGHMVTGPGAYGIFNSGGPVINGPIIHTNFLVDSGVLRMTNELRGAIQWRGGSLSVDLNITPTGVLNYGITGFNSLYSGNINNQGLIRWTTNATQPWSLNSGHFINAAGGLIDLQRDGAFNRFSGTASFNNHGVLRKSGGAGFSSINSGIAFTNTGTIEAFSGTLDFNGDYDMTGGLLKFGIAGNSDFGKIDVNGNAPLVGGVGAMLLNAFVPATNVDFQVMTFGSRNGTFADTSGLSVGSGRAFQPIYTTTTLTLRSFEVDDVVISQQPQALTVVAGSIAEFSVVASGTGTLTYQWRRNGTPLANTDTNRLVIPNAQPGDGGTYDVVVTSSAGSATSIGAALMVHVPPMLSLPPVSQQVANGQTALFTVAANGNPPPDFQWLFNGNPIPGATGTQLTIPNAMANQVGSYSVVVSNAAGVVTNTVSLTLVDLKMFAGVIIDGVLGSEFRVEFTTDVGTPTTNWTSLGTITVNNRPTYFFDVNSPDQPHRFYRAVPLP